jgi:hypothetical protein
VGYLRFLYSLIPFTSCMYVNPASSSSVARATCCLWENDKYIVQSYVKLKHGGYALMKTAARISLVVLLIVMLVVMLSARRAWVVSSIGGWNRTYGGTGTDYASALVQTGDGGYALAGASNGDAWLVKTDASGNVLWNRTYGGTGIDWAQSVVQTGDGGYALAGVTNSFGAGGFWLVKTDASGNSQWNRTYGGKAAYALVQTSDGGYAIAGAAPPFGSGYDDFWLVKTNSSGNAQWNQTYGGTSWDYACALVQTSDGGYALAGYTSSFGAGSFDFWLVKTDAYGNMQWNQTYGGTSDDRAYSVVQTGDGGYALPGETQSFGAGQTDVWLVRTDASGNMLWNRTYGGTDFDYANALVQTGDGGYALAGGANSTIAGDFWLIKTDANGNMQWNQTYGGTGLDEARALVQTHDGGYALAGSTTSFGAGRADFYLVKTEGECGLAWIASSVKSVTLVRDAGTPWSFVRVQIWKKK